MVQSVDFWLLLALSVCGYWLAPSSLRLPALAAVSFVYLVTLDSTSACWLAAWTVLFYWFTGNAGPTGKLRDKTSLLIISVLTVLVGYKYLGPLLASSIGETPGKNWLIPLGISYYSFKLIHYAIEKSRGNITNRSFGQFACYLFLFPIFSAGPIERYEHFVATTQRFWSMDLAVEGLTRIAHGLVKKGFIIALVLTPLYGWTNTQTMLIESLDSLSPYRVWYFVLLSFVISYIDFSAYSDIAIGCSRLFGFRIAENFNFPYLASDLSDFWRRWHISLVTWLQSYVYLPLIGLTRNTHLSTLGTFVSIGLWHAGTLNWLCWGIFHAIGLNIQASWTRYRRKRKWTIFNHKVWKILCIPLTFCYAGAGYLFVVMDAQGFQMTIQVAARMLSLS